jgi:hypothetical protein
MASLAVTGAGLQVTEKEPLQLLALSIPSKLVSGGDRPGPNGPGGTPFAGGVMAVLSAQTDMPSSRPVTTCANAVPVTGVSFDVRPSMTGSDPPDLHDQPPAAAIIETTIDHATVDQIRAPPRSPQPPRTLMILTSRNLARDAPYTIATNISSPIRSANMETNNCHRLFPAS